MNAPKVFISYSHDSPEHVKKVLELSNLLRKDGIDCMIDRYQSAPISGWPRWMERQIREADYVLLVCTEGYYHQVMGDENPNQGRGVCWEANMIYNVLYVNKLENDKYIPVLFSENDEQYIPDALRPYTNYQALSIGGYLELYRRLTVQPGVKRPDLGKFRPLPPITPKIDFYFNDIVKTDDKMKNDDKTKNYGNPPDQFKQTLVGIAADSVICKDLLNIQPDVKAFSSVLASKELKPPLCLGIFGDWGTGKTFFMNKMENRIKDICNQSLKAESHGKSSAYCSHIVNITFNAWHYIDSNLWASIACRIFEGLDSYITEHENNREVKANLFAKLQITKEKLEEAKREKDNTELEIQTIKDHIKNLKLEKVQKQAFQEVCNTLNNVVREDGLTHVAESIDNLKNTYNELNLFWGRLKIIFLVFIHGKNRWKRLLFIVIFLAMLPLVGMGLKKICMYLTLSDKAAAIYGQILTFVIGLLTWITKNIKWTNGFIKKVDETQQKADKIIKSEIDPQIELTYLNECEESAIRALQLACERIEKAEKEINEIQKDIDGIVLAGFIHERVRNATYQNQLGIVSLIRKDLQSLSELLIEKPEDKKQSEEQVVEKDHKILPKIDRIILYIDDLDRCPENVVCDVLQAVHLLLAFPLFIVVIGVDSRWLLRSLEHQYNTLQNDNENAKKYKSGSMTYNSTPQNYLEKIIQIPFNLRRMDAKGFKRLIKNHLPSDNPKVVKNKQNIIDSKEQLIETDDDYNSSEIDGDEFTLNREIEEPINQVASVEELDLEPVSLKITVEEAQFLEKLAQMIPTPRSAKRFFNIYQLIRASLSNQEMDSFLGKNQIYDEYQVIMILLAIQVGFPLAANEIFMEMLSCSREENLRCLCQRIKPDDINHKEVHSSENTSGNDSLGISFQEKKQLFICLDHLCEQNEFSNIPIEPFKRWIERVSRYSFRCADQDE